MRDVDVIVGGQYGSEGKGVVAAHIARNYNYHVRVGGPNAGHTFMYEGMKWPMQGIPCGWVNPTAILVIGRGAIVDPKVINGEANLIERMTGVQIQQRLFIDSKALVLLPSHHEEEGGVNGVMHRNIGSTGEGIGAARRYRLNRVYNAVDEKERPLVQFAEDCPELRRFHITDTVGLLAGADRVLIEGTQGFGLSLIHGYWPYVTSHDTTTGSLLADTGIAPTRLRDVIMVARTFPIRVAGNSGPLPYEVDWKTMEDITRIGGLSEQTTVTKKTRRIARMDTTALHRAAVVNGATEMSLMFMDYMFPDLQGLTSLPAHHPVWAYIKCISGRVGVPITRIGTGGEDFAVVDL